MKRKKIGLKHGTIKKQNFYEKKFFQLNFDKGAFTVDIDLSVPCQKFSVFYSWNGIKIEIEPQKVQNVAVTIFFELRLA